MTRHKVETKAESVRVLTRAGVPRATIDAIMRELPEVIDLERDEAVYLRHGISLGGLLDSLGSSP